MTEVSLFRRAAAVALVAALLPVILYLGVAATAAAKVRAVRSLAVIGAWQDDHAIAAVVLALPERTIRRAIAARPLDAGTLNVAMVRDVARHSDIKARADARLVRWTPLLAKLGWRDTTALQNRLYAAAIQSDLRMVLDVSDALMRRQRLVDQIITVLSAIENDPASQTAFTRRLLANPSWRSLYIYATAHLHERAQLQTRYRLLRTLERAGVRLSRNEIAPNIATMTANGLPQLGFDLWSAFTPGVGRPLADEHFARASKTFAGGEEALVPFEWELISGDGFSATLYAEPGGAVLAIEWDGRGVPVFARQRTSAAPGRYTVELDVPAEKVGDLSAFALRLVCGDTAYPLDQNKNNLRRFTTRQGVPCAFPVLELAGDISAGATPRHVDVRAIRMRVAS